MAEDILYEQIESGGDPDPLGLRKKLSQTKSDPLGLRAKLSPAAPKQSKSFEIKISQPSSTQPTSLTQEGTVVSEGGSTATRREFSYEKPIDPLAPVKLEGKARAAHENLQKELAGNRDVKVNMIKQRRFEEAARNIELPKSDMPQTQADVDAQRLIQQDVKPQDLPVTDDDLIKEDEDIMADRGKAVRLLEETMKTRPEKAKEIQKNVYLVDAYNGLGQVGKPEDRAPKIEANAKKIEKGEVVYDPRSGQLIKPLGMIGSAIEGWKQKSQLFADYDLLKSGDDSAIATELEKRRTKFDPDEPVAVPKGKLAEAMQMLGGTPIKPIAGGALASFFGTPLAGAVAGGTIGGMENAKMEYAGTFRQVYDELRSQGVEELEAAKEARNQAENAGLIGFGVGAVSGAIGAKMGARPFTAAPLSNSFRQAAYNVLKSTKNELGKAGLEGVAVGGVAGMGQTLKNALAREIGIDRELDEGVAEQIEGNLLATVAMAAAIKAGRGITKPNYKKLLHGLSKLPDEQIGGMLQEKVSSGEITQAAANETQTRINDYRGLDKLIPDNVTEDARFQIQDKIQKRNELEQRLESTDKAYHPALKEKIKSIDEEIISLSKEKEKPLKAESGLTKAQEKEAIETAEEFVAEGILPNIFEEMVKNDPIGFWKMVAQQSQNRDDQWRPLKENLPEEAVRDQFGDTVVDYAKELFPAPEVEPAAVSNVSVIKPGEIRQPEIITISPREQPSQISSTDKVSIIMPGERPAIVAEAAAPEIVAATQPESPIVVKEGTSDPNMIGITHRQMDAISEQLGLPTYSKDPETIALWDKEARERFAKDPEAANKLITKLRNGEGVDKVETRMMVMHMADLVAKYEKSPSPELLQQINRTKDLYNISGREKGKELAARKGAVPVEESLADFHQRDVDVNKAPLTEEQIAQSTKEYNEIKAAKEAYEQKVAQLQAENAKLKAEKQVKQEGSKSRAKKDFSGERKQIVSNIKEKLRKARGQSNIAIVPYANELIAIAPDVAKLVKSYVEQGITELPELVKHVRDVLKEDIPEITDKDVHNLIAGEYNEKKPTRNKLAQQLFDLKKEAKLINELEALQNGQVPVSPQKQKVRNQKIEALKQQINELRDEMGLNEKTDDQKLSALKARYKKDIAALEKKIADGDYGPDEKPEALKLDKEAQDLKDKYAALKREREIRLAKEEYENRSKLQKLKDKAIDVLNVPRTVMASADFSAPLRQGLVATISHPSKAAKALPEMFRQAFSQKQFDTWLSDLKESPDFKTMEDSGLYIADPDNLNLSAKEEAYMTNLAEKIPLIGRMVKGSERAYVAYLNKMRVDIFRQGTDVFEAQGRTLENSPELYEGLAKYINNATGRGGLGPMQDAAPILNTAFFSPRLIASRINMLNPVFYTKLPKEVRMMAIKDMAKVVAFGATILGLANTAGADVEKDPRSSDFGKIKVGNTRWDIWGGFQQYIRLYSQMMTGETKSTTGAIRKLDGKSFPYKTRLDQMASFFRGKLAPVPGTAVDLLAGKNVVGEEIDPANKAYELFVPMIAQDIKDAAKEQGIKALFTVGVPSALGVGTSTFEPKKSSGKSSSSKSVKKGVNKSLNKDLKK